MRVLLVCLGNICRSPAAEAALRDALDRRGLADAVEVRSGGLGAWHIGNPPDARVVAAGRRAGLTVAGAAAKVSAADLDAADLVLAMDRANLRALRDLAADPAVRDRIALFRDHDPVGAGGDVPDPYYGGPDGFTDVIAIVTRTAEALADDLAARLRRC